MNSKNNLDVFISIDVSGSMTGEPIQALNKSVNDIIKNLSSDHRTLGKLRIYIQSYNIDIHEILQLEFIENLMGVQIDLGFPYGPTHSGAALQELISRINDTTKYYPNDSTRYKKPLIIHITDGFPSDIDSYNTVAKQLSFSKINKISCGIGSNAELKYLKAFSKKVIQLEGFDHDSIHQFSLLLTSLIIFYLISDDDDLEALEVLNPNGPTNPKLFNRISII